MRTTGNLATLSPRSARGKRGQHGWRNRFIPADSAGCKSWPSRSTSPRPTMHAASRWGGQRGAALLERPIFGSGAELVDAREIRMPVQPRAEHAARLERGNALTTREYVTEGFTGFDLVDATDPNSALRIYELRGDRRNQKAETRPRSLSYWPSTPGYVNPRIKRGDPGRPPIRLLTLLFLIHFERKRIRLGN